MKYKKGSLVKMPPDEAAGHGEKLKLCDMKKSRYRVMESFEDTPKKVKNARKNTDKKQNS